MSKRGKQTKSAKPAKQQSSAPVHANEKAKPAMIAAAPVSPAPPIPWRRHDTLALAVIALATLVIFAWTVHTRAHWFGYANAGTEGQMTSVSAIVAQNWRHEGLWKLRFAQYWEPLSIDTASPGMRTPYISFPPGAVLPIYFISLATRLEPTVKLVMAYNLACQCIIALLLAALIYETLRRMGFPSLATGLFSAIPPLFYLLFPTSYFQHQMGYYSDQAVMLPYVLLIAIEAARMASSNPTVRRYLDAIQGFIMFWGILTDWLFAFVIATLYLFRLLRGEFGRKPAAFLLRSLKFAAPVLIALVLFAIHLHSLDAFDDLFSRFKDRAGAQPDAAQSFLGINFGARELSIRSFFTISLSSLFWKGFFNMGFGAAGKWVFFLCLAALAAFGVYVGLRKYRRQPIAQDLALPVMIAFLAIMPCVLYGQVFKNHCSFLFHYFTTLKFAVPMAVTPLVIIPAVLYRLWVPQGHRPVIVIALAAFCFVTACGYTVLLGNARQMSFEEPKRDHEQIGEFIAKNTRYEDVVFSLDYDISPKWPQRLVYSRKLVHQFRYADPLGDIHKVVDKLEGDYAVVLYTADPEQFASIHSMTPLANAPSEHITGNAMHLIRIAKKDFLTLTPAS